MAVSAQKWEAAWADQGNVLTTQLDGLTANSRTVAGPEYDNSANLDVYGKFELVLAVMSGAPAAGARIDIYAVAAPGGTDYEDGSDTVDPGPRALVESIPIRAAIGPHRPVTSIFRLPPAKLKFLAVWVPGNAQALAATGNSLKLFTNNFESQ